MAHHHPPDDVIFDPKASGSIPLSEDDFEKPPPPRLKGPADFSVPPGKVYELPPVGQFNCKPDPLADFPEAIRAAHTLATHTTMGFGEAFATIEGFYNSRIMKGNRRLVGKNQDLIDKIVALETKVEQLAADRRYWKDRSFLITRNSIPKQAVLAAMSHILNILIRDDRRQKRIADAVTEAQEYLRSWSPTEPDGEDG